MTIWQLGVVSITLISCLFGAFAGYMVANDVSERLQNAEMLRDCAAWVMVSMASRSHERTEAVLRIVEAA